MAGQISVDRFVPELLSYPLVQFPRGCGIVLPGALQLQASDIAQYFSFLFFFFDFAIVLVFVAGLAPKLK